MTEVRVTTLANGLRVASADMPGLESVAVGVWVNAGARNETAELNGVSHLLEHMAFKGTRRRNALAIAEEIESVGGHLNAYTSREQTAYIARVLKGDVPLAVDLLADILQHTTMPEDELAREREVVIQEIAQVHDTPDDIVFDQFQETAFPDQPIGRSILGTVEKVGGFSRQSLMDYMGEQYNAENMVAVAAGRIDHDDFVTLVEAAFDSLPPATQVTIEPAVYRGGDKRSERDLEQVHLVIGFNGVPFGDSTFFAEQVMSTVLGGGMSSRLFQEVREKRGLAYSVFSFATSYADSGLFGIYAGAGESHIGELLPVICDEVAKLSQAIDDDELDRARAQIKASLLMSLESPSSRCEQIARHMLIYGRPMPAAEVIEKIDAVDCDAVTAAARRLLDDGRPTVTALGPISGLESYETVVDRLG
ncbi:MAG: insulinase family protein [Proteobacteria bacterium]|nr:insulinase family protein [Pseudomonadota bacterium]